MLGIVVSLSWELKSLTPQKIPIGTSRALTANTSVALSGIGAERAYAAGSLLIAQGATALLSWGCAAALDDRLKAGSLMLPKRIMGANGETYLVNTEWHRRLYQTLSPKLPVHTNPLVESDVLVKTPAEKRALVERAQAAATDMESAAQARLAKEYGLPFVAIRAIVDTASTCIPENVLKSLDQQGNISVWKLLTSTFLLPADWIKIVRLGSQFNAAQKSLKKARDLALAPSVF